MIRPARLAVVLFNLGGPQKPDDVEGFLRNLFNDPAILPAPAPIRWGLSRLLAARRGPVSRQIYARVGGASPLIEATRTQAESLRAALADAADDVRVFVCMRYWHPMAPEVVRDLRAYGADRIVLLPLYPHFSTTTSGTSIAAFRAEAERQALTTPIDAICCYPTVREVWQSSVAAISAALDKARAHGRPRLLLSAHGLPELTIKRGDPYAWQVEQSAATIIAALARPELDHVVCYQSRIGPVRWIGPTTDGEIRRAGADRKPVVLAPISFVSENVETLVELDHELDEIAMAAGVPAYIRVPTQMADRTFIAALATLVRHALGSGGTVSQAHGGGRICPAQFGRCINGGSAEAKAAAA
jgi:ferrochelatase